jgi:iron complex transport system substrate-binding protein
MPETEQTKPKARPLLVQLTNIAEEAYHADGPRSFGDAADFTLLVVLEGKGVAETGSGHHLVERGCCVIAPPRAVSELRSLGDSGMRVCRLTFRLESDDCGILDGVDAFAFEPFWRMEHKLEEFIGKTDAEDGLGMFYRHIRFQELLYEVLRAKSDSREATDPRLAVERCVSYLERRFGEDVEIGRLAEREGLSRWRFERHFKAMTGCTPLDYLTTLRMKKAKELLASPSTRVADVAARVGYRDEYYFSRKFKQTFGMPPSRFARGRDGGATRIFSVQYLGELLALGVLPVGSNKALLNAIPEAPRSIRGVEDLPTLDMRQLSGLAPNLILFPSYLEQPVAEELSGIADAVKIDWESDVYTRLRSIGALLDREDEAESWIERYERKAERTRGKLRHCIGEGETAAAFIYHDDGLFVYAGHHFGHSLYHGIGFEPSPGVKALIDVDPNTKWKRIEPSELPHYAGDRVFMALPELGRAVEKGRGLLQHSAWRGLTAVQEGRSYVVSDNWGNYNPITLDKHLDHLAGCLQARRRA